MARLAALALVLALLLTGCGSGRLGGGSANDRGPAGQSSSPAAEGPGHDAGPNVATTPERADLPAYQAAFLAPFKLTAAGQAERFTVKVPASWDVPLGDYPTGLYWQLANVFSKDAGLDLEPLKGQQVTVYRYDLQGGLPGEGDSAQFSYPSYIVLLTQQDRVVGAWLAFNHWGVGPSLRKKTLKDLTGQEFTDWVDQTGVFRADGNEDLRKLEPAQVVDAFFKAINAKNLKRANACLSPAEMLSTLTTNLVPGALYNPGFGNSNSMTANILSGKLLSWKTYEAPGGGFGAPAPATGAASGSTPPTAHLATEVQIRWRLAEFNSPTGRQTRFIGLTKTSLGWKIDGMGTGP